MLNAIKELGLLTGGRELYDEISADKVIVLNFDEEGNFSGTYLEEFDSKKVSLYLYKKAKGSNPPTLTPTIPVSLRELKSKKEEKRKKAIEKLIGNLEKPIKAIKEAINSQNIGISIDGEIKLIPEMEFFQNTPLVKNVKFYINIGSLVMTTQKNYKLIKGKYC